MIEKSFKIVNQTGLDAKAASSLVTCSGKYNSEILISHSKVSVNLKSIMGVMSLNVHKGEIVDISFNGEDEEEACNEVIHVISKIKLAKEI